MASPAVAGTGGGSAVGQPAPHGNPESPPAGRRGELAPRARGRGAPAGRSPADRLAAGVGGRDGFPPLPPRARALEGGCWLEGPSPPPSSGTGSSASRTCEAGKRPPSSLLRSRGAGVGQADRKCGSRAGRTDAQSRPPCCVPRLPPPRCAAGSISPARCVRGFCAGAAVTRAPSRRAPRRPL